MKGVSRCIVGYSGGQRLNPTYRNIMDHTEALLIEFDPNQTSYEDLALEWSRMHSPRGKSKCQYRSAIWYLNEEQKEKAKEVVEGMKVYMNGSRPMPPGVRKLMGEDDGIYSSVDPATRFYRAEEYHQNFLNKQRF